MSMRLTLVLLHYWRPFVDITPSPPSHREDRHGASSTLTRTQSLGGCCGLISQAGLPVPVVTGTDYWLNIPPTGLELHFVWSFELQS